MSELKFNGAALRRKQLFVFLLILAFGVFAPRNIFAHMQPTTIVLLDVSHEKVDAEMQVPLNELELAFGHGVTENTDTLTQRLEPQLKDYLISHVRPTTAQNQPWSVEVAEMSVGKAEQTQSGACQEITFHLVLTPPAGADTRRFVLNYDAVMHQVVTHKALVSIRSDWETGIASEKPVAVGVIGVDTETTKIFPLEIKLEKGDWWMRFRNKYGSVARRVGEITSYILVLLALGLLLVNVKRRKFPAAENRALIV